MSISSKLRRMAVIVLVPVAVALSGCATDGTKEGQGRTMGTFLGAIVGAAANDKNPLAGAIVGGIVGNLIGGAIGKSMDKRDRERAMHALEHNRINQTTAWTNPDTGNSYRVTPIRTYTHSNTRMPCREYRTEAVVDGKRQVIRGRACRDANGNWHEQSTG